jgi:hypothetical protein
MPLSICARTARRSAAGSEPVRRTECSPARASQARWPSKCCSARSSVGARNAAWPPAHRDERAGVDAERGLPRADVPLQQPPHRHRAREVRAQIDRDARLTLRHPERHPAEDPLVRPVVDDRDARARAGAGAPARGGLGLELQERLEREAPPRGAEAFLGRRRMDLGDRAGERREAEALEVRRVEGILEEIGGPARGLGAQPAHEILPESLGERVDGLDRAGRSERAVRRADPRGDEGRPAGVDDPTRELDLRADVEPFPDPGLVEEERGDRRLALADRDAHGRAPSEALEGDLRDASGDDHALADPTPSLLRGNPGAGRRDPPRDEEQEVADAHDPHARERTGAGGPDAGEVHEIPEIRRPRCRGASSRFLDGLRRGVHRSPFACPQGASLACPRTSALLGQPGRRPCVPPSGPARIQTVVGARELQLRHPESGPAGKTCGFLTVVREDRGV